MDELTRISRLISDNTQATIEQANKIAPQILSLIPPRLSVEEIRKLLIDFGQKNRETPAWATIRIGYHQFDDLAEALSTYAKQEPGMSEEEILGILCVWREDSGCFKICESCSFRRDNAFDCREKAHALAAKLKGEGEPINISECCIRAENRKLQAMLDKFFAEEKDKTYCECKEPLTKTRNIANTSICQLCFKEIKPPQEIKQTQGIERLDLHYPMTLDDQKKLENKINEIVEWIKRQ